MVYDWISMEVLRAPMRIFDTLNNLPSLSVILREDLTAKKIIQPIAIWVWYRASTGPKLLQSHCSSFRRSSSLFTIFLIFLITFCSPCISQFGCHIGSQYPSPYNMGVVLIILRLFTLTGKKWSTGSYPWTAHPVHWYLLNALASPWKTDKLRFANILDWHLLPNFLCQLLTMNGRNNFSTRTWTERCAFIQLAWTYVHKY